ncbi:hypothetical protein [Prochlorococcus sp. MIT 0801]|uniref:hypothetical protein n=1 Tax=Prochlorococcus sp. MIT 0801 TaxID=1501269 RepID=UPI0005702846|nr:hypothetical protein [Prochlorococcus sp. MIT 0801]
MGQPQRIEEPFRRKRLKKINKSNPSVNKKIDAFTQVSEFQKEEVRRELLYSHVGLILKLGLFIVFATSLVNLGLASHQRVNRNLELSYLLEKESKKLHNLRLRFDEMFTNGGEQRFFKEQDQWITPNSVRVIWR